MLPPFATNRTHTALPSAATATLRDARAWLLLAGMALPSVVAAQEAANLPLRSLAASCAACHGTEGHSEPKSTVPALAHLPAAYFIARMHAFREDQTLASGVMAQIAKGFDDTQVEQLAAYFASQP